MSQPTPEQIGRMRAIKDILGMNGTISHLGAISLGAMAYVMSVHVEDIIANQILIHGLPGQITHINTSAVGAGFLITFFGVAFANFRMFPMVISTMGFIQEEKNLKKPIWLWLFLMHGCISTTWIRTIALCEDLTSSGRYVFYKTMAVTFMCTLPVFVYIGYELVQNIPQPWNLLLSIIAPLFLFVQGVTPNHRDSMTASVLGFITIVGLYPVLNLWAVIVGGVGSSLTAYTLWHTAWGKSINPFIKDTETTKTGGA